MFFSYYHVYVYYDMKNHIVCCIQWIHLVYKLYDNDSHVTLLNWTSKSGWYSFFFGNSIGMKLNLKLTVYWYECEMHKEYYIIILRFHGRYPLQTYVIITNKKTIIVCYW